MRRVFIAIMASEKIKQAAREWADKQSGLPVRWIQPENLHLTLIPPFEVNDARKIIEKIKPAARKAEPFVIRFRRVSFGPRPDVYRLIWAVGEPNPKLAALKKDMEARLGINKSDRQFLPHLTLARFKPLESCNFKNQALDVPVDWLFEVMSFALVQSTLFPHGAEYKVLKTTEL